MSTIKMFLKWVIILILFFIFVDIICFFYIASMYKDKPCSVVENGVSIAITESKATHVNGHVKGMITNTGSTYIDFIYVTANCISKHSNLLGTTYTKVYDLKPGETKEFEIKFKYKKVDHMKVSTTKELPENT